MGTYAGTNGADRYTGGAGDDTIDGRAGNDILAGGGGNDLIIGGAGADVLTGGIGADTFRGTAAALNGDTITDFEAADTIIITDANLATFSFSLSGNKLTYTGGSITFSQSLAGAFTASAAASGGVQLHLVSEPPLPTIEGASGNDRLVGTEAGEQIKGLAGDDVLIGNAGADNLNGGDGDDVLYSGAESPPYSAPGESPFVLPLLDTGTEVDTLIGGAGSDAICAGFGDNVDGGDNGYLGRGDFLVISFLGASTGVTVDFRQQTQVIGGAMITGIENVSWVQGSNYSDSINAGSWTDDGWWEDTQVYGMGGNDTLVAGTYTVLLDGGDGDDILDARASETLISVYGGKGADTIYAESLYVTSFGGDGNDTIYSNGYTSGGSGNDVIILKFNPVSVYASGDDGDDHITGADSTVNLMFGGTGSDVIVGGNGADDLAGEGGVDTLTGGQGADSFWDTAAGFDGDTITDLEAVDKIVIYDADLAGFTYTFSGSTLTFTGGSLTIGNAGPGSFSASAAVGGGVELRFQPRDPTIYGSEFGDNLFGTPNGDRIDGLAGSDNLTGLGGGDTLNGGDGNDLLISGGTSPTSPASSQGGGSQMLGVVQQSLPSSLSADTSSGAGAENGFPLPTPLPPFPFDYPPPDTGIEVDTLNGGAGADVIFAGYGDHVDGGANDPSGLGDFLCISFLGASSGVAVDFRLQTQVIGGGTITGIENITWVQGSNYGDTINVTSWSQDNYWDGTEVFGMGGNDTLIGGYYTTTLDGGDGNDFLDARNSFTFVEIEGGAGDDTIYASLKDICDAFGGDGNDTIYSYGFASGGAGNDTIIMSYNPFGDPVYGDDGEDYIVAADSADNWMFGGTGSDVITGGTGNETLVGGLGIDTLTGGAGADTFRDTATGLNGDVITDLEAIDKIVITDANLATFTYSFSGSTLTYSGGSLTLGVPVSGTFVASAASGGGVQLQLASNPGIIGTPNNDTLNGKAGNDRIEGLAGNDKINGNAGADVLVGGLGADVLIGGAGSDSFVYSASAESTKTSMDQIKGFEKIDVIDLSLIDAISATAGNDAFSYIGTQAFHHIAGELRVYRSQLDFFVEGDTNGDGIADLSILLTSTAGLGVDQFLL